MMGAEESAESAMTTPTVLKTSDAQSTNVFPAVWGRNVERMDAGAVAAPATLMKPVTLRPTYAFQQASPPVRRNVRERIAASMDAVVFVEPALSGQRVPTREPAVPSANQTARARPVEMTGAVDSVDFASARPSALAAPVRKLSPHAIPLVRGRSAERMAAVEAAENAGKE